ncbi:BZ3500_MvSof-1268-A1-R1_Chr2-1g04365 [Microbotryum saponariae]|uniref:BZ3500_MvSof-1268-A1-R1_Chr2-1g04365 protein n=1 Tax=Microbotryum saponariae TaxID=289078 RepID=A0A2X0K781_9BASI|nr:BZ3500_MvSof-1268-A1-R1_Chr2-1g04365 [Microbotryum saponariae]SCZ91556.1 BZ3501_MvSof-1269-A2-R1_Chr2-1g04021 [Microbotryum saponariae]
MNPPEPLGEGELNSARSELRFLERLRAMELYEQAGTDVDTVPFQSAFSKVVESRRILLKIMALARSVYAHPSLVDDTIEQVKYEPAAINSAAMADRYKAADIKDALEAQQEGKSIYLLARIISRPHRNEGDVAFAFEDQSGAAAMMRVSSWPLGPTATGPELDLLFPLGQLVAIKQLRRFFRPNETYFICPSPTDVVMLELSHPLVRGSATSWSGPAPGPVPSLNDDYKALGNAAFARKQWRGAIKLYSTGIDLITHANPAEPIERLVLLHNNRCAAHLKVDNLRQAHQDALKVIELVDNVTPEAQLEIGPNTIQDWLEKAWRRRAVAEERADNLKLALASYKQVLAFGRSLKVEAQQGIARVELMLEQSRTGKHYPWLELYERSLKPEEDPRMPVGNYIGPIRVVDKVEGRGIRGVIATSDIQVGELILAEKAFASGHAVSSFSKDRISLFRHQKNLFHNVFISRLIDDPTLIETLALLHHGRDAETAAHSATPGSQSFHADFRKPYTPVGDDFCLDINSADLLIAQISQVANSWNSRRCFPVCLTDSLTSDSASLDRSCGFQVVRGPEVIFPPRPIMPEKEAERLGTLMVGGCPYLSLVNHACFPNVTVAARFGDLTFVRAREFIPAGAEITMTGSATDYKHATRERLREKAEESGVGECGCRCCVDDKLDGASRLNLRKGLFDIASMAHLCEDLWGPLELDTRVKRLHKFVNAVEATYRPGHSLVRPELAEPLWELAGATFVQHTTVVAGRLTHRLPHSPSTPSTIFPLSVLILLKRAMVAMGCQMTLTYPAAEEMDPLREDAQWSSNSKIQVQSLGISSDVTTLLCLCLHMFTTMRGDSHADESRAWLQAAVEVENLTFGTRGVEFFKKRWENAPMLRRPEVMQHLQVLARQDPITTGNTHRGGGSSRGRRGR